MVYVKLRQVVPLVLLGMAHLANQYHVLLATTGMVCIAPYKQKIVLQEHTGAD
jgi:hypothetical protein